jgi:hypothetical protein
MPRYDTSPLLLGTTRQRSSCDGDIPTTTITRAVTTSTITTSTSSSKLLTSFSLWLGSYYLMAVLGGAVAYFRLPWEPTSDPSLYR